MLHGSQVQINAVWLEFLGGGGQKRRESRFLGTAFDYFKDSLNDGIVNIVILIPLKNNSVKHENINEDRQPGFRNTTLFLCL